MKTVTLTEARQKLSALLEETWKNHECIIVKKAGKPASVLMSYEEFESLASLNLSINEQLMADPHFQRKLRLSEEQLKSGRVLKHAQVKQKFARRKRWMEEAIW